jgi:hypothetical protein
MGVMLVALVNDIDCNDSDEVYWERFERCSHIGIAFGSRSRDLRSDVCLCMEI